jgi:DhnA family fructose-bisphosphate aldolase class Ia
VLRQLAAAQLVIYNGADYDPWMEKLLSAAPQPNRKVIVAAELVHRQAGDNPHLWYDPATMPAVAKALAMALSAADAAHKNDYAARLAMEMGADVVKLNFPKLDPSKDKDAPAPYDEMEVSPEEAVRQIVESAGRSLVVLSGGSRTDDETVISHTRTIMEAGGSGVIFGRNVWQREWTEALEIIEQIKETLLSNVRRIP